MSVALELLDRERILTGLTATARAGVSRLETYSVLDSTNRYLLTGAQEGWVSGAVCLAEQQTAGRGRHALAIRRVTRSLEWSESGDRHCCSSCSERRRGERGGVEVAE